MAYVHLRELEITDAVVRAELKRAVRTGEDFERAVTSQITRRTLPFLDMIEDITGTPIETTAQKSRKRSSQSLARCQWQRGHRAGLGSRRPEATIEFLVAGNQIDRVFVLEVSLQTDLMKLGFSRDCRMSQEKANQIGVTTLMLAGKYEPAQVDYWYLSPWWPTTDTMNDVLLRLQNMKASDNVFFTWWVLDAGL
jgi:hypothetical protein